MKIYLKHIKNHTPLKRQNIKNKDTDNQSITQQNKVIQLSKKNILYI